MLACAAYQVYTNEQSIILSGRQKTEARDVLSTTHAILNQIGNFTSSEVKRNTIASNPWPITEWCEQFCAVNDL